MARPRPHLYLYRPDEEQAQWSSGIEFREFISAHGPSSLLLVKHGYVWSDPHPHTGFVVIEPAEIQALCDDDPYDYGDFHLLDVPEPGALDRLSKQEIAEILYLSHKYEPQSSPFLPGLRNTFVYLAHDDGWAIKTYFRDAEQFYAICGEILRKRIERIHRRKLPPIPLNVTAVLRDWAKQGLYIDLKDTTRSRDEFTLNVYLVGADRAPFSSHGPEIDDLLNNEELYKETSRRALLRCYRRNWSAGL